MKTIFKTALAAAALVTGASNANAAEILTVTNVAATYSGAPRADINYTPTSFFTNHAPVTPLKVTGTLNSAAVELFAYCVDVFQTVGTGNFEVVSLLDYLGGNAAKAKIVTALIGQEGGSLDALLGKTHDASVQMALWELFTETNGNPLDVNGNNFFLNDTNSALTTVANQYLATAAGTSHVNPLLNVYVAKNSKKQDILFWTFSPAVPEPSTWAMMIVGMGAIGASLRQARRKTNVQFA